MALGCSATADGDLSLFVEDSDLIANGGRNVWAFAVIFCGHFPEGAEVFDEASIEHETRGAISGEPSGPARVAELAGIHLFLNPLRRSVRFHEQTPMTQPMPALEGGEPRVAGDDAPADVIPLCAADASSTLLERHRAGEREAFVELMTMFSSPVYSYLTRTGVPASERDDLFQEIFCKVHRASLKKMPAGPVKPWVLRIAVNTARDHFRRAKVRSVVELDADAGEAERPAPGADAELAARETARFLEAAIQQLPIAQREALLLASVAELGVKGAAEVLEVPSETVKTRLRRARATLALAMQRREQRDSR